MLKLINYKWRLPCLDHLSVSSLVIWNSWLWWEEKIADEFLYLCFASVDRIKQIFVGEQICHHSLWRVILFVIYICSITSSIWSSITIIKCVYLLQTRHIRAATVIVQESVNNSNLWFTAFVYIEYLIDGDEIRFVVSFIHCLIYYVKNTCF